jgi:hypothetical protein
MIREATKDTVLKVPSGPRDEEGTIIVPIPKGMKVCPYYMLHSVDWLFNHDVDYGGYGWRP